MDHLDIQGSGWGADPAVDYPSPLSSEDFSLTDNSSPLHDDVSVDAPLPLNEAALGFNDDVFTPLPPIPNPVPDVSDPPSSIALSLDASIPPLSPHSISAPPLPSTARTSVIKSAGTHSAYSYSSSSSSTGPISFTLPGSTSSGSLTSFHVSTSSSAAAAASGSAAYGGLGARPLSLSISTSRTSTPAGYTKPAVLLNSSTSVTLVPHTPEPPVLSAKKRARTPGRKSDFCKTEQTEEERRESKRQMRLYRNRLSAQQSRERKKQHVHLLEAKLQAVVDENKILEQRVHELTEENETLKRKLASVDYNSDGTSSPIVALSTDEPLSPPAKRLALLSPGAAIRTGATLFAFVFAFSILFSFSGLDVLRLNSVGGRSIAVAPIDFATSAPRGRVLHEWNTANSDGPAAVSAMPHVPPSALPAPSTPPLLPEPKHSNALQKLASHTHTVSVKVAAPAAPEEVGNHMAVDVYKRDQGDFIREAMEMYKTMLLRSNQSLATTSTSIMFCPSAIHIQPQMFTDKVVVSRDLASNGVNPDEEEEREALDPRNLLVWVPSKSLAPDWAASFLNASVKRRPSDVTELQVKIASVRPVHDETN